MARTLRVSKAVKIMLMLLILGFALGAFAACAKEPEGTATTTEGLFVVPDGITALGASKLLANIKAGEKVGNVVYTTEIAATTDVLSARILAKEPLAAIVPSNLAATAYTKGLGYKIAAVGSFGSFYIVSKEDIGNLADLEGRTIYSHGKGLTPGIVLEELLAGAGLTPGTDVTIEYIGAASEVVSTFVSGKAEIALVAEPALSNILAKVPGVKINFDLNKVWQEQNNSQYGYPQSVLIVRDDLSDADAQALVGAYAASQAAVGTDFAAIKAQAADQGVTGIDVLTEDGLTRSNLSGAALNDDLIQAFKDFYEILALKAPNTIGGSAPDEGIFRQF